MTGSGFSLGQRRTMDLLTDPLLPVVTDDGTRDGRSPDPSRAPTPKMPCATCPSCARTSGTLAQFCVQLAALALHRGGARFRPCRGGGWRELLRGLTAELARATSPGGWSSRTRPSRPSCSRRSRKAAPDPHRTLVETPDDLDVLVTSKNHGVKQDPGRRRGTGGLDRGAGDSCRPTAAFSVPAITASRA